MKNQTVPLRRFRCKTGPVLLLLTLLANIVVAQDIRLQGDVTGDGVIDGRDALKIMRGVEGLEALSGDETVFGDVHPFPGTEGRRTGDNAVTRDDAYRILRSAVGLVPEGELTGDFGNSTPVIDEVDPLNGPVGTTVTLIGQNFASVAGDIIVEFGDVPAPLLELSGTRIVTEVPQGASTGRIRVRTPGGTAASSADFVVGVVIEGVLDLGTGLDPQDFVVVNSMDEVTPEGASGSFSILAPEDQLSVIGAVPKDEGMNVFLSLTLPGMTQGKWGRKYGTAANPTTVNALSTAKTLLFMHPFFLTGEAAAADWLMRLMDSLDEVQVLADVIAERYPQGSPGLDDPAVEEAWGDAVAAIVDRLPDGLAFDVGESAPAGKNSAKRLSCPGPLLKNLTASLFDRHTIAPVAPNSKQLNAQSLYDPDRFVSIRAVDRRFLDATYDEHADAIDVGFEGDYYCPLDWLAVLYRVDPEAFSLGFHTPYSEIRTMAYPRLGYETSLYVPAKQWTAKIDIVLELVVFVLDRLKTSTDLDLGYDPDNEDVYLLRMFSGALRDPEGFDTRAIKSMGAFGTEKRDLALANNLSLALLDLWWLIAGSEKNLNRDALKNAVQFALFSISEETAGKSIDEMDGGEIFNMLYRVAVEAGKGIAQSYAMGGVSAAKEKLRGTLQVAANKGLPLLEFLNRLSSFGRLAERIQGLCGNVVNPGGFELSPGPTPLETMWIVVGDPFGPRISTFSPVEGGLGDIVTIEGERFAPVAEDNGVYFGGIKAEEVTVTGTTKLEVAVPKGLDPYALVSIFIETPRSDIA
ncbi:MAG: IPT/TIG domain-containing protein, partial [bacterium]